LQASKRASCLTPPSLLQNHNRPTAPEKDIAMMSDNVAFYCFVAFLLAAIASIIIYIFQPALTRAQFNSDNITFEKIGIQSNHNNEEDSYLLSLVVPAFNEEDRLPPMLTSTLDFLQSSKDELIKLCNESLILDNKQRKEYGANTQTPPFQIIIVNDGSSDGTVEALKKITEKEFNHSVQATTAIKLLTLKHNAGKGAAVKAGMLHCNAKLALMVDADGATNISSLDSLLKEMKASRAHMVFGSRAHMQEKSKAERSFVRTLLMKAFHFFVEFLIGNEILDTQCGFKLFRGDIIQNLFGNLHLQKWAFDTEIVVIAERLGLRIAEVGVEW